MTRMFTRSSLAVLAALCVCAAPAMAEDQQTTNAPDDAQVARLEALLKAQQQKIETLETRVADARAQDTDEQRAQMMRDQIRSVLSESSFRESLMPSLMQAGYDKGFYLRSTDEKFLLKINGYMQFRWTHYNTRTENRYLNPGPRRGDRTGFDLQRARLIFSGHMWTKDLTYHIQLRGDASGAYDTVIHWAFINYRFSDEFQMRAGIFKLASTRSQLTPENGMQFIDRSMVEQVFGFGDGVGVRFWGQLFDKRLEYMLDIVNSLSRGLNRTITNDPQEHDNIPAILFRVVWHALGDVERPSEKEWEGDVMKRESPMLDFGFHYVFNEDQGDVRTTRIPFARPDRWRGGGFGLTTTNGMQINQFGIDTVFKYMGFSAMGEYMVRIVDPRRAGRRPFTPWWLLSGDDSTTAQHGAFVQLGYFLPIPGLEDKLEAVTRIGGISALGDDQEGTWEYAFGLNYYLNGADAGHNTKLQFDVTKISEVPITSNYSSLANVNDDALVFRVQLQVGF